jgi:hypothetical protein
LQALASGVGPILLRFVYSKAKETAVGPGAMFIFAGGLYLVAVAFACALPKEKANSRRDDDDDDDYLSDDITDYEESESMEVSESYGSIA